MLIKHTEFLKLSNINACALYIFCGDNCLYSKEIFEHLKKKLNLTINKCELESDADWQALSHQLDCHHLFSEQILFNARWNKTTIEKAKPLLNRYLEKNRFPNLLLLQTPFLTSKQWQWLANNPKVFIVQLIPDTPNQLLSWIHQQFQKQGHPYEKGVPERLLQYTHGNPAALSQAMARLQASQSPQETITIATLEQQLIDECAYGPFELADACLNNDLGTAIHILRQAEKQSSELTLLLAVFCRFLRQCIECHSLMKNNAPQSDYQNKGIWPKHIPTYKKLAKNTSGNQLNHLLFKAHELDIILKSQATPMGLITFERLILQTHTLLSGSSSAP